MTITNNKKSKDNLLDQIEGTLRGCTINEPACESCVDHIKQLIIADRERMVKDLDIQFAIARDEYDWSVESVIDRLKSKVLAIVIGREEKGDSKQE